MLRTGIMLLFSGAVPVLLRAWGYEAFAGPFVRTYCLAALSTAFVLLIGFYCVTESRASRRRPARRRHAVATGWQVAR
jgi:hypothetical protein